MRMRALQVGLAGMIVCSLGGCLVVPAGEPVYEPPAVFAEPEVSVWAWWPWPHYEVEHHYVVENDRVIVRDRHYTPFYRQTHPYVRSDNGKHRGWYRHR